MEEVISSAGSLQVCAVHDVGCEAATHAMDSIFKVENKNAVLFIDTENTFNLVNRKAFLHNIKLIGPAFATFDSNCYSSTSRSFIMETVN